MLKETYIEKIFRLLKTPLVTPYNLLENAKLDNYEYVKFYKGKDCLIAEMKISENNEFTVFKYYFNLRDYLQKIIMIKNDSEECVFDRKIDLLNLKSEYSNLYEVQNNTEII